MPSDLASIEDLYRTHAPSLYRRSKGLLGSDADAGDIVQEAFVRYMNARYTKGSPFALLYRITTNLCIDKLRGAGRQDNELCEDDRLVGALNPGSRVESAMDLAVLTQGLKPKFLEVGVLYHVDGYTHEEIAKSLGLSRRSVGKHLTKVYDHMHQRAARFGYVQTTVTSGGANG